MPLLHNAPFPLWENCAVFCKSSRSKDLVASISYERSGDQAWTLISVLFHWLCCSPPRSLPFLRRDFLLCLSNYRVDYGAFARRWGSTNVNSILHVPCEAVAGAAKILYFRCFIVEIPFLPLVRHSFRANFFVFSLEAQLIPAPWLVILVYYFPLLFACWFAWLLMVFEHLCGLWRSLLSDWSCLI